MTVALIEHPKMESYRFGSSHPLRPERFTLSIELMRQWSLVESQPSKPDPAAVPAKVIPVVPEPASDEDLLLVHEGAYIDAVKRAERGHDASAFGIGAGDTPAFAHMHEAAALACGASITALRGVLGGEYSRAHSPGGGLHHAQRDRASGFCVYNDCAVAIERVIADSPGVRIAYIDIDAHHGDGVEAAFYTRDDVLTLSVHESGRYLFPGTGRREDIGAGDGVGAALNVPLPPWAGPACYELVARDVIGPAVRRYRPDAIVLQAGADSHRNDPLTHLFNSVAGFDALAGRIIGLADDVCGGRIVVTGGGGYDTFSAVPRMWACVMARLLGVEPPLELPGAWRDEAGAAAEKAGVDWTPVSETYEEWMPEPPGVTTNEALQQTETLIGRLHSEHPLLRE